LCSNRENTRENPDKNICKNITYERNKRVIEWYTNAKWEKIEWLWWNVKYYTTEFIKIEKSIDDLRYSFINMCDDLLCIKENTFEKVKVSIYRQSR
jgi:adenine-specific DNA-methyltransferase